MQNFKSYSHAVKSEAEPSLGRVRASLGRASLSVVAVFSRQISGSVDPTEVLVKRALRTLPGQFGNLTYFLSPAYLSYTLLRNPLAQTKAYLNNSLATLELTSLPS